MHHALNQVLVEIYRAATGIPSSRFKELVFSSLREHLDFDSAGWGTFAISPGGAKVHSVHVYRLPMQMMTDYEAVKQFDTLSAKALAKPGRTINVSIDNTRWKLHPAIVAHVRKWGLDHSLGTIHVDPALNICNAISLYRGAGSQPFDGSARAFKQQLMIHMVEAWNLNNMRFVEHPRDAARSAKRVLILVDREGMIYNADAGLQEFLCCEFPEWKGPHLPEVIARRVCADKPIAYRGKHFSCRQLRISRDGMILVGVRSLSALDSLTARETAVASLFADGKSHKEIAKLLQVAPATVRNQLKWAYQKLGVSSKIALANALKESG